VILTSKERAQLRHLELLAHKVVKGQLHGTRVVARGGPGSGFREHRAYHEGDPLRAVDWAAYARTDALVVKEFDAEEALDLVVVQDRSGSMEGAAATCAAKLTAALGALALGHLERVLVLPTGGTRPAEIFSGRARIPELLAAVDDRATGGTDLLGALTSRLPRTGRGGLAFVISDFFDPLGATRALSFLLARRYRVRAVLVEDPEALVPPPRGPARLEDRETGATLKLDVTRQAVKLYEQARQARADGLAAFCRRTGSGFLRVRAERPFFDIARECLARGWLGTRG